VKEIFVNKGLMAKRVRIMGKGRSGLTRKRSTHVTVRVDKVNFSDQIEKAKTQQDKLMWANREKLAKKLRDEASGGFSSP
jgi:hypothetical protein